MKKLTTTILACGALASAIVHAGAAAQLRLSDGTPGGTIIIADGDANDFQSATPGVIGYAGPVGANWNVNVTVGNSYPAQGSPSSPVMDVGSQNLSQSAGTLTIDWSDNGFTSGGAASISIGGTTAGSVSYQVFADPGNVDFAKTLLVASVGTLTPASSGGAFNGDALGTVGQFSPYSLTLEAVIQHPGNGVTGFDAGAVVTPPSCSCILGFNSANTTNCSGDKIPDVTAYQICSGISNSVPVSLVGATTNGTCPKIITRTYTATDNCGNAYTNIQTTTVNCKGSICGHIFADCDGSGDLTQGDVGLSKVVVSLLDSSNHVVATINTDSNGGYCFTNLSGGCYTVSVTPPTGYSQTAASTSYHWKDGYGRDCWSENDGYIHCKSSGTECWWDKSLDCHWKDGYGRDCWKDKYGSTHCQPCGYQSCNAQTNNNKLSVCLTNCTSQTDVDFDYTGSKCAVSVCVTAPSYVKCGQSYTYTCTVTNTGNVCFTGGKVCHTVGNCSNWGGWNNCTTVYDDCPPLSPGQKCTFTHKYTCNSWNNTGTVGCQSSVTCNSHNGNSSGSSSCYSQCGW